MHWGRIQDANSADADQITPKEQAVWSGPKLFAT